MISSGETVSDAALFLLDRESDDRLNGLHFFRRDSDGVDAPEPNDIVRQRSCHETRTRYGTRNEKIALTALGLGTKRAGGTSPVSASF